MSIRRNEHDETQCSAKQFEAAVAAAQKLSNVDLVRRVKTGFQKIAPYLADIQVLHDRFKAARRGKANIDGCKTFSEFCTRRLFRNYAHIARLLKAAQEPETARILPVQIIQHPHTPNIKPVQITTTTRHVNVAAYHHTRETTPPTVTAPEPSSAAVVADWLSDVLREFQEMPKYGIVESEIKERLILQLNEMVNLKFWLEAIIKAGAFVQ